MPNADGITSETSTKLQVRINQIDYVLKPPGQLDNASLPKVPVLRVFGSSSTGQNACVHIHQVYPYLFIQYFEDLAPRSVKQYISKLFHSLNHAIALSLKRNPSSPKSQYIRAILLVKGVHFYGFHTSYTPFLKILVTDPAYMTRVATILQSGSVMGSRFSVYESHLSYILQFLCDFGLRGCGTMDIEEALERCGQEEHIPTSAAETHPTFEVSPHFRESRLPLEVDIIAPHILNRHQLAPRDLHHRLQIPGPPLPSEPLVVGVRELWEDERRNRHALGLNPSPEIPIDPSEASRSEGGAWVAEARWWTELRKRIEVSRADLGAAALPDVDSENGWERFVMTTFESVEAVWEKRYKTWKPKKRQNSGSGQPEEPVQHQEYSWEDKENHEIPDQIQVDISLLSNQAIEELDQTEAFDWNKDQQDVHPVGQEEEDYVEDLAEENEQEEEEDSRVSDTDVNADQREVSVDPFLDDRERSRAGDGEYRLKSPPMPCELTQQPSRNNSNVDQMETDLNDTSDGIIVQSMNPDIQPGNIVQLTPSKDNITMNVYAPASDAQMSAGEKERRIHSGLPAQEENLLTLPPAALTAQERSNLITARAVQLSKAFDSCKILGTNSYTYTLQPPTLSELKGALQGLGIPEKIYQAPFYSKDMDIPEHPKEYAGLTYRLKGGQGIATLEEWSTNGAPIASSNGTLYLDSTGVGGWEFAGDPPSAKEIRTTIEKYIFPGNRGQKEKQTSQIEGPTQANIYGFKSSPLADANSRESTGLSNLSVEIFVPTIDCKIPDAEKSEVIAIFYAFHVSGTESIQSGALVVNNPQIHRNRIRNIEFETLDSELDLLNRLIDLVIELDPDILTGWEVQLGSWGYLGMRSNTYGLAFSDLISRAPPRTSGESADEWGFRKTSTFKVAGRHVFNLWRIMRSEKNLTIYSFENVVFEILRRRVPKYGYETLTEWFNSDIPAHTSLLVQHLLMRVITNLQLLEMTETITKTAEFARVFGVDFFSVLSRGSQFKVESFMFRIAKPESFVLISPSKAEVGRQNGAECMPLIMEPASAFYSSPLLVLDFQSLYPSIMIAYNYCYSTCLGRITDFKGTYKFGVIDDLDIPSALLEKLQDHINVAPNGIMYVKSNVRKGLLGRMLVELLETRVMVKQAMKRVGGDKARKRILDARQLSLKYIANVIYGYTSASFSGRMPAVEIADSIVQSGRETLEKAIDVIDSTPKWGAKVVYGDTDSVFVYLPGKTKEQAFAIGNEISETVTAMNPVPIKLKFEKVYLPCVLMAKKRYVGFKYENIDDVEPVFDAKGIETVRRDAVLAQRKMVENCLKVLFRTQDLSEVKNYCCRSWTKLLENKASIYDFIFAKEVRMGTYSDKGPPPPGAVVAARRQVMDPNNEPQYGDRIPYVIVRGDQPGSRLVDRAMDPLEFMNNSQLRLDALYYITRVLIPPLERIFNLVGADVKQWFNEMPKYTVADLVSPRKPRTTSHEESIENVNINAHFLSTQCLSCGNSASESLCETCAFSPQETITTLGLRIKAKEERMANTHSICVTCTGSSPSEPIKCISLDCPWFFARRKTEAGLELIPLFKELIEGLDGRPEDTEDNGVEGVAQEEVYEIVDSSQSDSDIYI